MGISPRQMETPAKKGLERRASREVKATMAPELTGAGGMKRVNDVDVDDQLR